MSEIDGDVATAASQPLAGAVPLCVDLDGTLIRSDTLIEGVLATATSPALFRSLLRLRDGNRAAFKRAVASAATFDPALLPYHAEFLAFLHRQKAQGRRIILVTAADMDVARRVADHVGVFDEVIASDGVLNLKGPDKAAALLQRFGQGGFAYAGDSAADLHVWAVAQSGILVNASRSVSAAARAATTIDGEYNDRSPPWTALLKAARPHQWVKNLLVFVPLFVSGSPIISRQLLLASLAFAAFCATASGIYLLNDLMDLSADRKHQRKRMRPFASGAVSLRAGIVTAVALIVLGLALGGFAGIAAIVVLYAALSTTYSAKLKELPLVDVFMLAALYTIRLVGGGEATGNRVSLWLLAFSSFLFLSLALVKRVGELSAAGTALARRGYAPGDIQVLQAFGCSSAIASSVVLALFIQNEGVIERHASPVLLWGVVPLILFWLCRLWLSTSRGYMHDDPIVYAARDWVSWLIAGSMAILMLLARFVEATGGVRPPL